MLLLYFKFLLSLDRCLLFSVWTWPGDIQNVEWPDSEQDKDTWNLNAQF